MAVKVSEGHHHEESIDNKRYELVNIDTKGRLFRLCGSPFRNTSENLIGEPPLHEQNKVEASHGNVAGVLFTHKVGAPWYE